ncbi:MAG: hypothetical protein SF187_01775 [Deltaproteobacteria bacterium]|nr:hypothetical protein [Deltaproteobacteria bacterium]
MFKNALLTIGVVALAMSAGCDKDPGCPDNGVFGKYGCEPATDAAADVAMSTNGSDVRPATDGSTVDAATDGPAAIRDAGSDDAMSVADTGAGDAAPSFGSACSSNAQCTGAVDYCSKQPGAPVGYCTHTGCNTMPAICPANWSCLNLGMFAPNLPHVCAKPAT